MPELSHDETTTVNRAVAAMSALGGCIINPRTRTVLGDLIAIDFPEIARGKIDYHFERVLPDGMTLTDETILKLATHIAILTIYPVYIGVDPGVPGGDRTAFIVLGPRGERRICSSLSEVIDLVDRIHSWVTT